MLVLGPRPCLGLGGIQAHVRSDGRVQHLDNGQAPLPSRRCIEGLVKGPVPCRPGQGVVTQGELGPGMVDDGLARNGLPQQDRLHRLPEAVDLPGSLRIQNTNLEPAIRHEGDQPFGGQSLQRFADGDLADAEMLGQRILLQPFSRSEFAGEDSGPNACADGVSSSQPCPPVRRIV